jgi:hypothetical protein
LRIKDFIWLWNILQPRGGRWQAYADKRAADCVAQEWNSSRKKENSRSFPNRVAETTRRHFRNHSSDERGRKYKFLVKVFNSSVENRVEMNAAKTNSFCNAKV